MSINRFWTGETLVYFLLLYIKEVICITEPGELAGNVGGNVTFKWTATPGSVKKAEWGLYTRSIKTVIPLFMAVPKIGVPSYDSSLDNNDASRYKGRVHFIGNISQGRAWFYLTNLTLDDTNEYGVILSDKNDYPTNYDVKLTVTVPPTTTSPPTTAPTTPTTNSTLNPTNDTTNGDNGDKKDETPTPGSNKGAIIAGSVCAAIALCGACAGGGCYCYKKSGGSSRCCKCTCLSTFPCCSPCCFLCCRKRSDQNDGKGDVPMKNKVENEGSDNQTQPSA